MGERGKRAANLAASNGGPEDALLSGSFDSPALERYRLARAKLSELELAERESRLVNAEALVRTWLGPSAALMRECGHQLRRRYGNEAGDMLDETLSEIERLAKHHAIP